MQTQIDEPKMRIIIPRLSELEIRTLIGYAERKLNHEHHVPSMTWLMGILCQELERRNRPGREPEMLQTPFVEGADVADALLAFHILSRGQLTLAQAAFIDEIFHHVLASAVGILELCHAQ